MDRLVRRSQSVRTRRIRTRANARPARARDRVRYLPPRPRSPTTSRCPRSGSRCTLHARMLASLNHPHIAAIYGFEDSGETHALVFELVEGETIADRVARGAIPVDEALPIARQICEALEAAHEQCIIHRDLKPANIKITPDGG